MINLLVRLIVVGSETHFSLETRVTLLFLTLSIRIDYHKNSQSSKIIAEVHISMRPVFQQGKPTNLPFRLLVYLQQLLFG